MTSCFSVRLDKKEDHSASYVNNIESDNYINQSTFSTIAMSDTSWIVRYEAVNKLTNQATLSTVAMSDERADVRRLAVQKLNK